MEQKLIATIRQQIINSPTRSTWNRGVLIYALELFDNYIELQTLTLSTKSQKRIYCKVLVTGVNTVGVDVLKFMIRISVKDSPHHQNKREQDVVN